MFPDGFEKKMQTLLGSEYPAFAASYARPRNVGLRLNPLKTDTPPNLGRFGLTPVPWCAEGDYYDPETRPGLSAFHEAGLYYLQEPSAMAPAMLLDATPGERVLDLCAAPGGKSTQLAGQLRGRGLLVSNEIHPKRAQVLSQNIERLGIANALVLNEPPKNLLGRFDGWFDKILVDAPCSGEGMFRKEQAAVTDWSPETVRMCADRQLEILCTAAKLLRPGGRLVYSTCTFSPEENESVISTFLHEHAEFSTVRCEAPWFSPGRPDWVQDPAPGLENTFRLFPHLLRGEGHFAAVLQKADGTAAEPNPEPPAKLPPEVSAFATEAGAAIPAGKAVLFGSRVWLAPEELPELKGLRVLRAGLELGECKKNRFEPAHAWALWLQTAASVHDLTEDDPAVARYLAGEALTGNETGWTLVRVNGLTLGWVKGSGGQLKNHYPKGLRRNL